MTPTRVASRGVMLVSCVLPVLALGLDFRWQPTLMLGANAGRLGAIARALICEALVTVTWVFVRAIDHDRENGAGLSRWRRLLAILALPMLVPIITTLFFWLALMTRFPIRRLLGAQLAVLCVLPLPAALALFLRCRIGSRAAALVLGAMLLVVWLGFSLVAGPYVTSLANSPVALSVLLAFDPLVLVTRTLGADYLRGELIYRLSPIGTYRFAYPNPWAAVGMQLALAGLALAAGPSGLLQQKEER